MALEKNRGWRPARKQRSQERRSCHCALETIFTRQEREERQTAATAHINQLQTTLTAPKPLSHLAVPYDNLQLLKFLPLETPQLLPHNALV
eukprot:771383-Pleurochrysis_carterae.AAC.5